MTRTRSVLSNTSKVTHPLQQRDNFTSDMFSFSILNCVVHRPSPRGKRFLGPVKVSQNYSIRHVSQQILRGNLMLCDNSSCALQVLTIKHLRQENDVDPPSTRLFGHCYFRCHGQESTPPSLMTSAYFPKHSCPWAVVCPGIVFVLQRSESIRDFLSTFFSRRHPFTDTYAERLCITVPAPPCHSRDPPTDARNGRRLCWVRSSFTHRWRVRRARYPWVLRASTSNLDYPCDSGGSYDRSGRSASYGTSSDWKVILLWRFQDVHELPDVLTVRRYSNPVCVRRVSLDLGEDHLSATRTSWTTLTRTNDEDTTSSTSHQNGSSDDGIFP